MPGVRLTAGADLRFPPGSLRISMGEDGVPVMDTVIPLLRTDMWPYWLAESVDAAVAARRAAQEVDAAASDGDDARIAQALEAELRSSMRAVSSAAFAVDAFYASVEARSPHHPHRYTWREKRTPRHAQVFETIRYNLKLRTPGASEARRRIVELFKFRGWAVHPGAKFRQPVFREDVDAGVDWHFAVFSALNAVNAVALTVSMLDMFVAVLHRGSEELVRLEPAARDAMNQVLDAYEAAGLPEFDRAA